MICKYKGCGVILGDHYWGDGYHSKACMHSAMKYDEGERLSDRLTDPTDPTGRRVIAENMDEIDAMLEAAQIDARLPKIIYWRKRGLSKNAIEKKLQMSKEMCGRILEKAEPSLLRACGLRV